MDSIQFLSECQSRKFGRLLNLFAVDIDIDRLAHFLLSLNYISSHAQNEIKNQRFQNRKIECLLYHYRRSCDSLDILAPFFQQECQQHIAKFCNASPIDDLPFPDGLREKLLICSRVPQYPKTLVRHEKISELQKVILEMSEEERFIVAIHGLPGVGKSVLAAQLLQNSTEIFPHAFENVIYLQDGSINSKQCNAFLIDLYLSLSPFHCLGIDDWVYQHDLEKLIEESLIDHPKVLIVVDKIVQAHTLAILSRLPARFLVTLNDASLMERVKCPNMKYHLIPDMTFKEFATYYDLRRHMSLDILQHMENNSLIFEGIPAVMNELVHSMRYGSKKKLSTETFDFLNQEPYNFLNQFESHLALLPENFASPVCIIALLPLGSCTDFSLFARILPYDKCDSELGLTPVWQMAECVLSVLEDFSLIYKIRKNDENAFAMNPAVSLAIRKRTPRDLHKQIHPDLYQSLCSPLFKTPDFECYRDYIAQIKQDYLLCNTCHYANK